ncbi:MAG: thermonuclease family protein, partial [Nitrosopumilus sp.]
MKSKISLIIAMCSIPLILLIVTPQTNIDCAGNAMCLKGKIAEILDGETILVEDTQIKLALISTQELEFSEPKEFLEKRCPVGSDVLVDEDDGQIESSYDRIIGKVFCRGIMLNEE